MNDSLNWALQRKPLLAAKLSEAGFVSKRNIRVFITLLLLFALMGSEEAHLLFAQEVVKPPMIQISEVDSSKFPQVTVSLLGADLPVPLSDLVLRLEEDSVVKKGLKDEIQNDAVAIQAVLAFDASGSTLKQGPTGKQVFEEVGMAARNMIQQGNLGEDDWLTSVSFGATNSNYKVLHEWDQDHQAVADSLYTYQPAKDIGNTSIEGLLRFAIDQFDKPGRPEGQVRYLVLFSDGIDIIESPRFIDAVQVALAKDIRIYPVLIGPGDLGPTRKMQKLANDTSGQLFHLNSEDALIPLWQKLAEGRMRRILTYHSTSAKPSQLKVTATLPDAVEINATHSIPAVTLQPAKIAIAAPVANLEITKDAPFYNTPVDQLEPKILQIVANATWGDGFPRALVKWEFEVAGRTEIVEKNELNQSFEFPIASLGNGDYSIRVRAIDELGLIGESQPIPFKVIENRPPPPTDTPDPTVTAVALEATRSAVTATIAAATSTAEMGVVAGKVSEQNQQIETLRWTTIAAAVFGVLGFGYAFYILSNRDRRKRATEIITGTVAAATQPFVRRGRTPAGGSESHVRLRLEDDAGTAGLPQSIPLTRVGVRIGRDPALVNILIPDRRVSKLHCRIIEDPLGYRLVDEGSTSGTYVNDQDVGMQGHLLQHNDLISFGPVAYRYEDPRVASARPAESKPDGDNIFARKDDTEIYLKSPKSSDAAKK